MRLKQGVLVAAILQIAAAKATGDSNSCAAGITGVESRKDHGGGFCEVVVQQGVSGGFEGIAHLNHCYQGAVDLGRCDGMWVSPSKSVAVWQDGPTGKVFWLRKGANVPETLIDRFPGLIHTVLWNEGETVVRLQFDQGADLNVQFQK